MLRRSPALAGLLFLWFATSCFAQGDAKRGEYLSKAGGCLGCHTVEQKEGSDKPVPYAGGRALSTPFGTFYGPNITPHPEAGIGRWSEAAFLRAMHQGIDREGNHLYPAFPYDHFTLVSDEDNRALYAYLMTRQPVEATAPRNDLIFPLNIRPLVAAWDLLFLKPGPYQPDPAQSEEWNRGAYLAEGLGHCGACHTPRNPLGAERRAQAYSGGEAEGWIAYAINSQSPAPIPWTKDSLAFYLRHGFHPAHGVSRGPMAEVTGNLAGLPDADVAAIATYIQAQMGTPDAARAAKAKRLEALIPGNPIALASAGELGKAENAGGSYRGVSVYRAACASCHESGRALPFGGLPFQLSTAVSAPDPQNIINVVLYGLPPADGEVSAVMPAFGSSLSDADLTALLNYLRSQFSDQPQWSGLREQIAATRSGAHYVRVRPADGIERSPANVGAGE